jgi:hypothetical protein
MLERNTGVFVCVSSAGAAPYMGAYEVFKTAQVELARTLDAELGGTGVIAFTIGPGLVRTPGAEAGIAQLAPLYGKTVAEFYAMSEAHILSVEAAGAGFAAAIALASRFRGQEIGSIQALATAGIHLPEKEQKTAATAPTETETGEMLALCREVHATLAEQSEGWRKRPFFERQWVFRDFKQNAGMPVEQWLELLGRLEGCLEARDFTALAALHAPVDQLAGYYAHLQQVAAGYEKDPKKLEEQLHIVRGWQDAAHRLGAWLETSFSA